MKQYGDITRISGAMLEPVDLIVGGSPCQNLSQAGNRQGLEGQESRLFLEMIRVIKQMRRETDGVYPRYALWENVPGAFSSNEGRDFQQVLTEFCRIAEPGTPDVPMPEEGWTKAGVLLGPDWSIAWRTHDAQFWGKAIRDSRTGNVLEMGTPQRRRRIALVMDLRGQSAPEILFERKSVSGNSEQSEAQRKGPAESIGRSVDGATLMVFDPSVHHGYKEFGECSETVRSRYGTGGNNTPFVVATMQGFGDYVESDTASSCKQRDYKDATDQVCRIQEDQPYVRRLTPLEAERLQGLPDNWTNIPGASDSRRYRAIGNGIALPFWEFLAKRFVEIGEVKSIGSLFDGIGSFPLAFKRAGAETKWTSEIEPFCEDVVRYHYERGEL